MSHMIFAVVSETSGNETFDGGPGAKAYKITQKLKQIKYVSLQILPYTEKKNTIAIQPGKIVLTVFKS